MNIEVNEKTLGHAVTMVAKLSATPVVIKFNKLLEFAKTKGFDIKVVEKEFWLVSEGDHDKVFFNCEKLEELNEWFIGVFGVDPLVEG